jgi:hypothetical protein
MNRALDRLEKMIEREERRALHSVQVASNHARSDFSVAQQHAADNLLHKAALALDAGDCERAEHYVGLAVRIPFDEHEVTWPSHWAGRMMMFRDITDALEASEPGDARWLEGALQVYEGLGHYAGAQIRSCLRAARQDWKLVPRESRRIKEFLTGTPEDPALARQHREEEIEDPCPSAEEILDLLGAVNAYRRMFPGVTGRR